MWSLLFDVWQQVPQMDSRLYRCYKTCYHLSLGLSQQQDISGAPLLRQTEHYLSVLTELALHTLGRILKIFYSCSIIIMITFSNNLNRKLITINVCVKCVLTLRWIMSYIYGAPILDVSRSHTTTQHSR